MISEKRNKEAGLAIISVLLVVALMTTLMAFLVEQQFYFTKRIANSNEQEMAYFAALGGESFFSHLIQSDDDLEHDFVGEDWWQSALHDPGERDDVEGSSEEGENSTSQRNSTKVLIGPIEVDLSWSDLQGRYNLNNLLASSPENKQEQKQIFINLLTHIGVDDDQLRLKLHGGLVDWLDSNEYQTTYGKESNYYQTLKNPYHASDLALASLGTLGYIDGFTAKVIEQLSEYACVLPVTDAKINVNSASATVLASLSQTPIVNVESLESFLSVRDNAAFTGFSVEQVTDAIIAASGIGSNVIPQMMQTNSEYFQVKSHIVMGPLNYTMTSKVKRNQLGGAEERLNQLSVISRERVIL